MEIKRGIPVSPGVAIGPALVLDTEGVRIPQKFIASDHVEAELQRLYRALDEVASDARETRERISARLGASTPTAGIFDAHASLVEDHVLRRELENYIRKQHFTAEYAVSRRLREYVKQFEEAAKRAGPAAGEVLRRATDLVDLEKQILNLLLGERKEPLNQLTEAVIVLAIDLMPSETAEFSPRTVRAFATESGGLTSHTAILAGALELPAVVGVGRFLTDVSGGDRVIVDGHRGLLIIDPDEETVRRYEEIQVADRNRADRYDSLRDKPATTLDGTRINLLGNIELEQEAAHCLERGADGVGLYRTEFLYLNKLTDPTEKEHYDAYCTVLRTIGTTLPVVIRTLDLGADKFSSVSGLLSVEKNPFLGLRSVRLCLRKLDLFKTQLRAILRSAVHGNIRVMFPMITTIEELRQCKHLLNEVKEDLEEEGIPFKRDVPVGTMIEVPSAALLADNLAKEVDFFSVGTNDLVQYTLAADRNNEHVANLYSPADPAVLRLIRMVVEAGRAEEIDVNVCGEMSGETLFAPLLLGLGLRQLSATPRKIPEIKRVIRNLSISEAERIAQQVMKMETARQVMNYLRDQLRRILPDTVD